VDWLIIASACPRPIRFVIHHSFLSIPLTRRIFKDAKVIPIAGTREDQKILESAFAQVAAELRAGELVCIFPEGKITQDGELDKFRPGVERIIQETPVPVIPMALDGLWGSFFSRKDGKPLRRPFRRVWSRVSLTIGEAVAPGEASAEKLERLVRKLLSCPQDNGGAGAQPDFSADCVSRNASKTGSGFEVDTPVGCCYFFAHF